MASARFIVTGKVQGVCFRAATRERALALGLRGWARNRADGSVEVLADGNDAALAALAQWLAHGPPSARVSSVVREDALPADGEGGFIIG